MSAVVERRDETWPAHTVDSFQLRAFRHTSYNMDELEGIVLGEISQSQKQNYCRRTLEGSNS